MQQTWTLVDLKPTSPHEYPSRLTDSQRDQLLALLVQLESEVIDDQIPEGHIHPDDPRSWRGDALTGRTAQARRAVVRYVESLMNGDPFHLTGPVCESLSPKNPLS